MTDTKLKDMGPYSFVVDQYGNLAESSLGTKYGNAVGGGISNVLRLEEGSTPRNVVTSGFGVAGFASSTLLGPGPVIGGFVLDKLDIDLPGPF